MTTTGLFSSSFKRLMRVNYYLLALVLITLLAFSLISNKTGPVISAGPHLAYILNIALFIVVALAMFAGFYLPVKMLKSLEANVSLDEKVNTYLKSQLIRMGLFSLAAIVVSVYFLLTADQNILLIKAIVILFMLVYKPTKLKTKADLLLTDLEYNELFGED